MLANVTMQVMDDGYVNEGALRRTRDEFSKAVRKMRRGSASIRFKGQSRDDARLGGMSEQPCLVVPLHADRHTSTLLLRQDG